ncbi:hypothetical protein F4781DRAFT_428871 [Annulohypoxylon bovei var. microspora]|nr:hypothetical protein F4781DRAFT_428871 [Annulohypoxylon bovei var. microspora]
MVDTMLVVISTSHLACLELANGVPMNVISRALFTASFLAMSTPQLFGDCVCTGEAAETAGYEYDRSICLGYMLCSEEGIEMGIQDIVAVRDNPSIETFRRKQIPRPENRVWVFIAKIRRPSRNSITIEAVDRRHYNDKPESY